MGPSAGRYRACASGRREPRWLGPSPQELKLSKAELRGWPLRGEQWASRQQWAALGRAVLQVLCWPFWEELSAQRGENQFSRDTPGQPQALLHVDSPHFPLDLQAGELRQRQMRLLGSPAGSSMRLCAVGPAGGLGAGDILQMCPSTHSSCWASAHGPAASLDFRRPMGKGTQKGASQRGPVRCVYLFIATFAHKAPCHILCRWDPQYPGVGGVVVKGTIFS